MNNQSCHVSRVFRGKVAWMLVVVIAMGAALRLYHFKDWMHYQLDQARDYRVVHAAAVYGPGELPLQGPRAAGSFLRLGPWLYYLEYASVVVFGDTPAGSVAIVTLLNIVAIGLFFAFARRVFDFWVATGVAAIFAASLFLVSYSRFGWNPNLLVPFTMLLCYALVRVSDNDDARSGWWLVVAAGALGFLMSAHFVAFVTMPIVGVAYLAWTRAWPHWRYWAVAVALLIALNVPLIVNDVKTGGANARAFADTLISRGGIGNDSDEEGAEKDTARHTLTEKIVRNTGQHVQYYWMIVTGDQMAGLPTLSGNDVRCDYDCRQGFARGIAATVLLVAACAVAAARYRRTRCNREKDVIRIVALWAGVVFAFYTPLAYDLAPRFFLLVAPVAIIAAGFVAQGAVWFAPRYGKFVAVILLGTCVAANMVFVVRYFGELRAAPMDPRASIVHRDRILKERVRVTFGQMMAITDWMEGIHRANGEAVFIHAQPEYKRALWERIDVRGIPRDPIALDLSPLYRKGNYFVVLRSQSDQEAFLEKFLRGLTVEEKKEFGTLTAYYLRAKPELATDEEKIFGPDRRDPVFSDGVQVRYLWRQIGN